MLATMIIELALAAYALWRYRADTLVRIFVAMFVFLAIFQWAEYNICEGAWGLSSLDWARVGFASITILPALGLHAILVIAGVRKRHWIYAVYAVAAIFMAFFLFVDRGMGSQVCQGNYVIFDIMPDAVLGYTLYYYGLEIIACALALYFARRIRVRKTKIALYGMAASYLVLLIPTTTVTLIDPSTMAGIPSIMCGFAVFTALIIGFVVLPRVAHKRLAKS